ncbi:MAG: hypothetical protein KA388_05195 [Rhodocyclaceae bacterium]|nr:hypothetical protein [Rhodocyclaceae bacterium]MBP6279139.1 hypothetical protein [Rhodocyclaceae bacterium]
MLVSGWMRDGEWAEEDKRLLLMVGLSLLLHASVLWLWKSPRSNGSITISALTVLLPQRTDSSPTIPPPPPLVTKPVVVAPILIPLPTVAPKLAPALPSAPVSAPTPASLPAQDRASVANQGVQVVLRLSAAGEVVQIFWNRLPALNDEQFRRLESSVRARHYGAHLSDRSITEVIDVRALLSLPAVQSDGLNSVSPAPTGETGATNPL